MSEHDHQFEYSERRGFGAKYGFVIGIALVGALGVFLVIKMLSGHSGPAPRKAQEMVMIKPPPPPPPTPPPPPPPPQDAPQKEMMSQEPVNPDEAKPEPQEAAAPSIGTNVTGNGPDAFGLVKNTGSGWGNGSGTARANASRFGWYANQVIKSLSEALTRNSHTKNAGFNIKAKIWSDAGGRVIRAKLVESTGDPAVDEAIKNEVLVGFQLKEPPPDGMDMPIVMRLIARRPN